MTNDIITRDVALKASLKQSDPLLAFYVQELNTALGRLCQALDEQVREGSAHKHPTRFPRNLGELLDRLNAQQAADEFVT